MSSTEFQAGLGNSKHSNVKVLKPPGGGSSDIFGGDQPQTPRSAVKNHMKSNIFTAPEPLNKNGDKSRRVSPMDSYNRLFGDAGRSQTPAKNHMKSSILIGSDKVDTNGKTNGTTNGMNGHSEMNGKQMVNGNGIAHTNGHHPETAISKTNGNPVTGEGYIKPPTPEVITQVPALNGSRDHVINKNRIPPGGFSSGLW
jgi:hypothetical protein